MERRGRAWVRAAICAGVALVLSACSDAQPPAPSASPGASDAYHRSSCSRSDILVPACGVLWGVATQTPSVKELRRVESQVGRSLDLVYRFHQLGDAVPTADERQLVASGHLLHLALDSRGLAANSAPGRAWSEIAEGRYDDLIRRTAEGVASLRAPVFVTFEHEVNNPSKAALGDPASFVAAWRHIHQAFDKAGATNVVWVWVVMGSAETVSTVGTFWPGNAFVDWISWDVYNQSGCLGDGIDPARYESFLDAVLPVYRWVHAHGAAVGMDVSKPMMISEAGSVIYPGQSELTARWYAQIPAVLERFSQIKAIGLWDHTGHRLCDYRFDDDPAVLAAVAQAGTDPKVLPPAG